MNVGCKLVLRRDSFLIPGLAPPTRDIPMPLVSSGVEHGNLRELALARMKDMGTEVRLPIKPKASPSAYFQYGSQ